MIHNTVETFDGSVAFRKDCRFIKGKYYIKNKQCFLINDTWYRVNSGLIIFDNEKRTWVVAKDNTNLIKGIIGYDSLTSEVILGSYSSDPYKNVLVNLPNGSQYSCIDYKILPDAIFNEDAVTGMFNHVGLKKRSSKVFTYTFNNNSYPFQLPYCCKHYDVGIKKRFEEGLRNKTFLGNKAPKIANYGGVIGKYSFGIEFETNRGKIPNYKILDSGLLPLRDGSIEGIEFATLPLSGQNGVNTVSDMCDTLRKYTNFTTNESLHLHIGNIPTNTKFIAYLYTLCSVLENEIYSMFPAYYSKTSKFKPRGKDYNMPLRKELVELNLDDTFNNIAFYLGAGKKYQGLGSTHPSDPNDDHKWGIVERYHWVNFIPLLFGDNKTIEFRCHVPTQDPIKIINWLYICSAIIKYAEITYKDNIDVVQMKGLTLRQVIDSAFSNIKLASYLTNYISDRKLNRRLDESSGDCIGLNEIRNELSGVVMYKDIN